MARGTLKMLLPAALKYAPNSAAFFLLTAGDTTDTQLCLSVFWCGVTQFAKHHFFWRARYQYLSFSQKLYYVRCYVILIHFAQRAFCSDDKWQSFAQSGVPFLKGKSVIWEMSFFEHFCLARIKAAGFMGACSLLVQRESVWLSELHHGKLAKSAPDKSYFILLQEIDQQVAIWSSRRESKSESNWVVGLTQIARFDSGSSAKNKTQRFAFSSFEMSDDLWFVSRVGTWKIQIYLARASMSCRKIQQTLTIQAEIRFPPQKTCKNPFKLKWSIWVWTWFLQGTAMYAHWLFKSYFVLPFLDCIFCWLQIQKTCPTTLCTLPRTETSSAAKFLFPRLEIPCCTLLCSGNRTLWTAQKTFNRAPLSYLLNVIYILYIIYIYIYKWYAFPTQSSDILPLFEWELMFGCTHWGTWHDPVGESHPVGQPFTGHASDHCP